MDAVTYPDETVAKFIEEHLIPLRVRYDAKPLSDHFNVRWTPTLVVLDQDGNEHRRTTGFLPPKELIPALLVGMAKVFFDQDRFDEALPLLDNVVSEYPASKAAPEAVYFRGVSHYKRSQDPQPLKQAYETLTSDYPESEWANKAYPYSLL